MTNNFIQYLSYCRLTPCLGWCLNAQREDQLAQKLLNCWLHHETFSILLLIQSKDQSNGYLILNWNSSNISFYFSNQISLASVTLGSSEEDSENKLTLDIEEYLELLSSGTPLPAIFTLMKNEEAEDKNYESNEHIIKKTILKNKLCNEELVHQARRECAVNDLFNHRNIINLH